MVKKNAEYKGIQKKLVAAIAMVLVASIMVVTSSYAWFTLSTAPEVTGITTSVGSNGNLEIALLTNGLNSITNSEGGVAFPEANRYWGNLVDLSSDTYHLDDISLMPAALNAEKKSDETITYMTMTETVDGVQTKYYANAEGGKLDFGSGVFHTPSDSLTEAEKTFLAENGVVDTRVAATYGWSWSKDQSNPIKVPTYGADGRIDDFNSTSSFGLYDTNQNGFVENNTGTGVRAVGVMSNLSPAELMLRNARKDVSSARGTALNGAINSLTIDAVKIAEIAIKNELGQNFTTSDIANLRNAEKNLRVIVDDLEDAIYKSVIALGVSQGLALTEDDITIDTTNKTIMATNLKWKLEAGTGDPAVTEEEAFDYSAYQTLLIEAMTSVESMRVDLNDASTKISALEAKSEDELNGNKEDTFNEIVEAASNIVNPTTILIEGKTIKGHGGSGNLVGAVASGMADGVDVVIPDGIYVEIAKFVGNYTATTLMTVDTTDMSMSMGVVSAKVIMSTDADEPAGGWYLNTAYAWLLGLKAGTVEGTSTVLSDLYAYAIDLAFRTNAASSNLLLQTAAANRVAENEVTQGGGSYMEFTSGHPDFTIEQMANLMENIRVVFYKPDGTILAVAALDVDTHKTQETDDSGNDLYYVVDESTQAVTDETTIEETDYPVYVQATDIEGNKLYEDALGNLTTDSTIGDPVYEIPNYIVVDASTKTIRASLELYEFTMDTLGSVVLGNKMAADKQVITSLVQNQATAISAMVYLDGNKVENADVAIGGESMTGKLNLQFASSATLTPMDYDFGERLATPKVEWDSTDSTLTITNVEKATAYEIYAYGHKIGTVQAATGATTSHVIDVDGLSISGTYEVTVVATASGYVDSKASEAVQVTFTSATTTEPETTGE